MLLAQMQAGRSLFVSGAAGVGKTALLQATCAAWGASREAPPVFYCADSRTRRSLVTHLLVNLLHYRGCLHSTYIERPTVVQSLRALQQFVSSTHLPALYRMLHHNLPPGAWIVLDQLDNPDPKVASMVEVWLERARLILVARNPEDLGRCRWLLSTLEHVEVPALSTAILIRLAREMRQDLARLTIRDSDVRRAAVRSAGNPRRFQELLTTASKPQYQRHGAIMWNVVDIDLRIRASVAAETVEP